MAMASHGARYLIWAEINLSLSLSTARLPSTPLCLRRVAVNMEPFRPSLLSGIRKIFSTLERFILFKARHSLNQPTHSQHGAAEVPLSLALGQAGEVRPHLIIFPSSPSSPSSSRPSSLPLTQRVHGPGYAFFSSAKQA